MKKKVFLCLVTSLLMIQSFCVLAKDVQEQHLQKGIAQKVLRFHIMANSDSEKDQQVKEKVRDAVGGMLQPYLAESTGLEESKSIVNTHMEEIISTAKQTLRREGYAYNVTAQIVEVDFPEKTYGEYTFPPGKYEALQIFLGEGKGHNWWCVLYPNMCFRGSVYEIIEEDAKTSLREVLTPEEYREIFNKKKYKIRFKFLEYFK